MYIYGGHKRLSVSYHGTIKDGIMRQLSCLGSILRNALAVEFMLVPFEAFLDFDIIEKCDVDIIEKCDVR